METPRQGARIGARMVAQGKEAKPKVRTFTLGRIGLDLRSLVAERLRKILPNAGEFVIVTRRGKAEVQVQVRDGDCR